MHGCDNMLAIGAFYKPPNVRFYRFLLWIHVFLYPLDDVDLFSCLFTPEKAFRRKLTSPPVRYFSVFTCCVNARCYKWLHNDTHKRSFRRHTINQANTSKRPEHLQRTLRERCKVPDHHSKTGRYKKKGHTNELLNTTLPGARKQQSSPK